MRSARWRPPPRWLSAGGDRLAPKLTCAFARPSYLVEKRRERRAGSRGLVPDLATDLAADGSRRRDELRELERLEGVTQPLSEAVAERPCGMMSV